MRTSRNTNLKRPIQTDFIGYRKRSMLSKLETALNGIGRTLIGGYRTRNGSNWWYNRSRYMPHQGKQEAARRLARMQN